LLRGPSARNMFNTVHPSFLAPKARVMPSQEMQFGYSLPLTDASCLGRHTSHFVFPAPLTSKGIPYPGFSSIHDGMLRGGRRLTRRGLVVGKSDHRCQAPDGRSLLANEDARGRARTEGSADGEEAGRSGVESEQISTEGKRVS
jgi:hypothetical protein